jgi:hypothetical protein
MSGAAPSESRLKRVLRPAVSVVDRVIERRGSIVFASKNDLHAAYGSLTKVYTDLLEATTDVRRWLADDLDAGTETAAVIGRSLARMTDCLDRLGDEVAALGERMERIEAAVAGARMDAAAPTE